MTKTRAQSASWKKPQNRRLMSSLVRTTCCTRMRKEKILGHLFVCSTTVASSLTPFSHGVAEIFGSRGFLWIMVFHYICYWINCTYRTFFHYRLPNAPVVNVS